MPRELSARTPRPGRNGSLTSVLRRRVWLFRALLALREGFWFLPAVGVVLGASLCGLALVADAQLAWTGPNTVPLEVAVGVSAMVAGSVLGITSTTFTIVMAVLTLASSQFGPRLLGQFLKDGQSQLTLATFVGVFGYHLVMLSAGQLVDGPVTIAFVGGLLATVLMIAALVMVIEHFARSVHADVLIARVGSELEGLFDDLAAGGEALADDVPSEPPTGGHPVCSDRSGYLQGLEIPELLRLVEKADNVLRAERRLGEHVLEGEVLFWARDPPDEQLRAALLECVWIGDARNSAQDPEFVCDQLSEMAVRAMSPGINDPFTAERCVHRLVEGLAVHLKVGPPESRVLDDKGEVRLWLRWPTFRELTGAAFHRLRHAARDDVSVALAVITGCHRLALRAGSSDQAVLLERAQEMAATIQLAEALIPSDQAVIEQALQAFLEGPTTTG